MLERVVLVKVNLQLAICSLWNTWVQIRAAARLALFDMRGCIGSDGGAHLLVIVAVGWAGGY